MLAFALSFDEVIVTTFTAGQQSTLPIWMLTELIRPRQRPVTNVVAVLVIAITLLPILAAYYLTREGEAITGSGESEAFMDYADARRLPNSRPAKTCLQDSCCRPGRQGRRYSNSRRPRRTRSTQR